ncbi:hypothetical protein ZWY2020_013456 [Hordeum vulgare]|nr:hypothetical protein ZWY2020_013456 [Hordeum vulgare]
MQVAYEYQLAVADYWEGRPTMEPNVWVPALPLQMTVAAPAASNTDLVVSSTGQQQLVEKSADHQHAVELMFKEATQSLKHTVDKMEMKMHLFPASMEVLAESYAVPTMVSMGPYHHGETPALQEMESIKHAAAGHFIDDTGFSVQEVYGAVCAVAGVARSQYDAHKLGDLSDDEFKPMMFFDGCFLLQYMLFWCKDDSGDDDGTAPAVRVHPSLCSVFSANDSRIFCDLMLLENQLPWVVVDTLKNFMPSLDMKTFIGLVKTNSLHSRTALFYDPPELDDSYTPPHLLGLLRYYIVGNTDTSTSASEVETDLTDKAEKVSMSVSVIELAEMGIEVTANENKEELRKMYIEKSYFTGELRLASVSLDDKNASFLVNMAAFELCTTPDFAQVNDEMSTVCSYLCLLGMVTDGVGDVQELRNKHILEGGAGLTNEDALKLFNELEKHLRPGNSYYSIIRAIENYRSHRWRWIKFYRFCYRNRTAIIATLSAVAGIAGFLGTLKSFQ